MQLSHLRELFECRNERGVVIAEYVVLLVIVAIVAMLAIVALGTPLLRWFLAQRTFLLLGVP